MYSSSQQQQMTPEQQQQLLFRQQQALLQQAALLQQQAALLQPTILPPSMSQIEPIPSGNLPPGFDASSCRSVYVGNIHPNVSEALLAEFFSSVGPLEGCKLIRKEKSSYGFIDYFNHRYAATAILSLNGRPIFGQPIKVNWAYTSGQREDTSAGHFSIFVGDLSAEVTDAALYRAFSIYPSCSDGRVMWDQTTGRSRGFGFVSFKNKQEADQAITEMTGKRIGSRAIRCNWAAKNSTGNLGEDMAPAATHGEGSEETDKSERPENNPQFTTVYVGNLAHEVSQAELHQQFHAVGAGVIEEVRLQRDKGFGFVRYRTHEEAARAIQLANGRIICGKSVKCSWGNKPTPTSLASTPLPPPSLPPMQSLTSSLNQGYSAADIYAYQRQLGATQGGAGNLLTMSNQLPTQPNMGYVGAGAMAGSLPSTWTAPDGLQQQPHLY